MTIKAIRYHDFSAGHRVCGHENKCAHLHGHNYRVYFHCNAKELDGIGRVIDFSVIKQLLCEWIEENWDHKMLIWTGDSIYEKVKDIDSNGVIAVPFNPTAENMAKYLVDKVAPDLLPIEITLDKCVVWETRKCGASYELCNQ